MPWTRRAGWRSQEEHFLYDARLRRYISDSDQPSATPAAPLPLPTYLDALAEIRRAMLREPATEWETGLLIRLYADTAHLQALAVEGYVVSRRHDGLYGPLNVLRRIVEASEAVIRRTYPDQVTEIARLADLAVAGFDQDHSQLSDPARHLNAVADQIVPRDGAAMRAVWLASFSRPASWGSDDSLWSEVQEQSFISACAELARDILADAGPIASSLTTGLARSAVPDQDVPS